VIEIIFPMASVHNGKTVEKTAKKNNKKRTPWKYLLMDLGNIY
jgi:hypothetical protein